MYFAQSRDGQGPSLHMPSPLPRPGFVKGQPVQSGLCFKESPGIPCHCWEILDTVLNKGTTLPIFSGSSGFCDESAYPFYVFLVPFNHFFTSWIVI